MKLVLLVSFKGRGGGGGESSADSYECDFLHSVWGGSGIQNRTDLEDGSRTDGRLVGWWAKMLQMMPDTA